MRSLIWLLLIPALACAQQVKEIGHSDLFGSTSAQTAIGGTITKSSVISLIIESRTMTLMPTRGYVWIAGDGSQCDDDTMKVLVIGYQGGKESFTYLDTLYLPIDADSSNMGEFSFTLPQGEGFISKVKLGYTPESGSADDSIGFYSGVLFQYGLEVRITGVQVDDDTLSFDATKADLASYVDTSKVIFWPDTIDIIPTNSDTIPLHNQIELKLAIADTAPLHNQIALKLNIADTSSFSNQFALKLNISDTSSFSNQFALKLNISDTLSFANQFALKLNSADTNYTDSTDVRGWNYMNEDSILYATQTDLRDQRNPIQREYPFWCCEFLNRAATQLYVPWYGVAVSSGTCGKAANNIVTLNHPGVVVFKSSTTANSGYRLQTDDLFVLGGGECFEAIFFQNLLTNTTVRLGYLDTGTSADATDGVYFEIPSTGALVGKTATASTRSTTGTSYTISVDTWYRAYLALNVDATRVDFYLYDMAETELWTDYLTTNIPTGLAQRTGSTIIATNSGTTALNLIHWDYIAMWYNGRELVR